jgi:hypothetical protein
MRKDTLIATCSDTSTKPSQSTNTPNRSLPNMLPTKQHQPNMAHKFRGWRLTPHNYSPQKKSNVSKTLLVPYCTMHKRLIQHFFAALSTIAAHQANGTRAVAYACHQLLDYAATHPNAIDTKLATWYFQFTQMPPTFPNLVVKAKRQDISTYQIAIKKTSTMVLYSHC